MSPNAIFTVILLLAALAMLVSQRVRADVTALLVMLALVISGVLTPEETFGAFGQPVIIIIASIFILGTALYETGVTTMIANQILRLGGQGEIMLLLTIMLITGLMSAVLDGLLVVAMLMPAVLRIARQAEIAPSRLLLPLATVATVGNQGTLIGAVFNLVGSDALEASGYEPLGLFTLTPYALASLGVAVGWYLLVGRRFLRRELPAQVGPPSLEEVQQGYQLDNLLYRLRVRSMSDLIAAYVGDTDLRPMFQLNVIAVQSQASKPRPATANWVLEQDDVLIVAGDYGQVLQAAGKHNLELKGPVHLNEFNQLGLEKLRLAEVIIPFRSRLVGKNLADIDFRSHYGLNVLAIQRHGQAYLKGLPHFELAAGDTLLVQGPGRRIQAVSQDLHLLPVTDLGPQPGDLITGKAGLTLGILGAMLVLFMSGLLSLATASFAAAIALIVTNCISIERAYQSMDASFLILVGGMFPLTAALEKTGATETVAQLIAGMGQSVGAVGTLLIFFLFAGSMTQIIANVVVTALLAPIAIELAVAQGFSPEIFVIAVIFGANASYATPLTDADNLMVREAGQYTMRDYLLHGLSIFVLQTSVLMIMFAFVL